MLERFSFDRAAAERSAALAERLEFDLTEELGYRYPDFSDGDEPAIRQLAAICRRAIDERYPTSPDCQAQASPGSRASSRSSTSSGSPGSSSSTTRCSRSRASARARCAAPTRRGASSRPGAGAGARSARSSATSPGLSHVDPVSNELSLGRFLNRELASVPDIDLDFPRDIREKLIVRVTERYGREHAALVASFATYRRAGRSATWGRRSASRSPSSSGSRGSPTAGTRSAWGRRSRASPTASGSSSRRRWRAFAWLTGEIAGLPRHVSQHPGGMIVSTRPLIELVPVQPAAMAGRQLCQWDKDSCSDAGFLKIDLLGLGMLSAVEDCVEQIARTHDEVIDLSRIPFDDEAVYDDIQRADTVGTFQIESRAQMQSLLRTKPANLDDITVQVALVRPGPIQGKAVHPYIDARQRLREDPSYVCPVDHELLREPLRSTFGVVVFQDQVLEVAIALAGFTVGEAEGLRRAMSRKRSHDALEAYRGRFIEGAAGEGRRRETADPVFDKLVGFSGFGFPKAHAAAFGLLAYQSTWLRRHYPAEFLCALLNAQPMGFYPPATLVRDAQRPGWRCSRRRQPERGALRRRGGGVRIGLNYISSIGKDDAEALVAEREAGGPFRDIATSPAGHRSPTRARGARQGRRLRRLLEARGAISSGSSASSSARSPSRGRRAR